MLKPEGNEVTTETFVSQEDPSLKNEFGFPDQFWTWLEGDQQLRAEFEKMIEVKAREKTVSILERERAQAREEGHKVGYDEGIRQGIEGVKTSRENLETVCALVLKEKASLLQAHEALWIQSLSHILRRFLVANRELAMADLEKWIHEGVMNFEHAGRIRFRVSPLDYERLSKVLEKDQSRHWELVQDAELLPGELNCDCGNGGMLLSTEAEYQRLNSIIDRFIVRESE